MKKKNVINLIKYYSEKNDAGFRTEAYKIASDFDKSGDYQLSEYIMALMSNANTFVPQMNEENLNFLQKVHLNQESLPLPEIIKDDIVGVINAINHNVGINKFLFEGAPGTGKTETVKHVARILERELFIVNFDYIVDSKLGQTSKNVTALFNEIAKLPYPERVIVLFDEIDAIALDRLSSNDLREMGRATSAVLKGLDNLNDTVVLIATTNLYNSFDKALSRRFDAIINFNRYTQGDLIEVAETLVNGLLDKFKFASKNTRLLKKILNLMSPIPYPGELKNLLKTCIAFGSPNDEFDYLKRLYTSVGSKVGTDLKAMQEYGFTVREIEILTGVSKSQVARELKE